MFTLDDYICGKDETTSPQSPYYDDNTEEEEETPNCSDCSDYDHELLLASDIITRNPVFICIHCAVCIDDEKFNNLQVKAIKNGRSKSKNPLVKKPK